MDEQKIIMSVLGELSPEEQAKMDASIASNPQVRQRYTELRDVVNALKSESGTEVGLTAEQKTRLLEQCLSNLKRAEGKLGGENRRKTGWWADIYHFGVPLAVAACLGIALLVWQAALPESQMVGPGTDNTAVVSTSFFEGAATSSAPASSAGSTMLSSFMSGPSLSKSQGGGRVRGGEYTMSEAVMYPGDVYPTQPLIEGDFDREEYNPIEENEFKPAKANPLSTFSIDVDTASYSNVRRFLNNGQWPAEGSVRTEEMINYFRYNYPAAAEGEAFSITVDAARAPWSDDRLLVRVGLRGRELPAADRPASNLVFLIDTSGSMNSPEKFPLLKKTIKEMLAPLGKEDRVSIVTYAGSAGVALPPTSGANEEKIVAALDSLMAGGSTAGAEGIIQAYALAEGEAFIEGGNNRVILCTDGDFNVGLTSQAALEDLIVEKRKSGVFLTVLGFGLGNIKDATLELLANKGNGNYAYIDSIAEARKVLGDELGSTLFTIAKDVKIQVEFNPAQVEAYRLIGYENRMLAAEDFNNDQKDAGEIGAGHTVTAFYEVVLKGGEVPGGPSTDPLKYQTTDDSGASGSAEELLTVKVRYKEPTEDTSKLEERVLRADELAGEGDPDFNFGAAVAAFAMKLRETPHTGDFSWDDIKKLAMASLGEDEGSHRAEFLTLVEKARQAKERP